MRWHRSGGFPEWFRVGFLVAGVQKAGTFSLFQLLRQHPKVGMSTTKEVHFFDNETTVDWSRPTYNKYHSYFVNDPNKAVLGEATPIYIYWPNALKRIKTYSPDIKLILLFRDPIGRAFSGWCHQKRKGRETLSFSDAIRQGRERISTQGDFANRHFSYVERGFYGCQLDRVLQEFPKENILCIDSRQLSSAPSHLLDVISTFLGLDTTAHNVTPRHANKRPTDATPLHPSAEDVKLLAMLFAPDLDKFARLVDFSIDHWPTFRLLSGWMSAEELAAELAQPGFDHRVDEAIG
jgi:hypothetical protein